MNMKYEKYEDEKDSKQSHRKKGGRVGENNFTHVD